MKKGGKAGQQWPVFSSYFSSYYVMRFRSGLVNIGKEPHFEGLFGLYQSAMEANSIIRILLPLPGEAPEIVRFQVFFYFPNYCPNQRLNADIIADFDSSEKFFLPYTFGRYLDIRTCVYVSDI